MAISPPAWCAHAIPTPRGWEDPDTGELFVSARFSGKDIQEFFGEPEEVKTISEVDILTIPQMLREAPVASKSLEEMTKVELEALGRQHGIELDRRLRKDVLVEQLSDVIDED